MYGSEAIGGVINIITEEPVHPLKIDFEMNGGGWAPNIHIADSTRGGKSRVRTFPSQHISPSINFTSRKGEYGLRGGMRIKKMGVMDTNPLTPHTNGSPGTVRANQNLRYNMPLPGPTTLILSASHLDEKNKWSEDSGLPAVPTPQGLQRIVFDDLEINEKTDLSAEIRCEPKWAENYFVKAYSSRNDHSFQKLTQSNGTIKDFTFGREDYQELSGQLTRKVLNDRHRLITGADYYKWSINTESKLDDSVDVYSGTVNAWDLFLQDEWFVTDKLMLVPGLRYENHQAYGTNLTQRVSMMYTLPADLKLRASWGQGYRAPTSKELFMVFNHSSVGYIVYGNKDLQPEESDSYTVSLEHTYESRHSSRITFFRNDLENMIDFDSTSASDEFHLGIYMYKNILSARTEGIEIERGMRIGKYIDTKIAYSFMKTVNHLTGERLLRRPTNTARMNITWHDELWTMKLWGKFIDKMLYQGEATTDEQVGTEWTVPYAVWNLAVTRRVDETLSVYIKGQNLFDTFNTRYGPYQGRVITFGMRLSLVGE